MTILNNTRGGLMFSFSLADFTKFLFGPFADEHINTDVSSNSINVLVNMAPLKSGGGQNVGLNFVECLDFKAYLNIRFFFLVAKGSKIHEYLITRNEFRYFLAPSNPVVRILYERLWFSLILRSLKIDIVYSLFGYGWFGKSVKQVIGMADSNLFYPELDFWKKYSALDRFKFAMKDKFKIWGLKRADGIVFETSLLLVRANKLFEMSNAVVINPSFSDLSIRNRFEFPSNVPSSASRVLFLCGWQENKGIMLIPAIAASLKSMGIPHQFILTASLNDGILCQEFFASVARCAVQDCVYVVDGVSKDKLADLYSQVKFVMLLSMIESFSNNIIEAWNYEVPLVISKGDWSLSICGDAAIYVDRDSPEEIANKLFELYHDNTQIDRVIANGRSRRYKYPSPSERIQSELAYVKEIFEV